MRTDYNSKKQGDQSDLAGHLAFLQGVLFIFRQFSDGLSVQHNMQDLR